MHPASRILTYLAAALALPGLPFFMLSIFLLAGLAILLRHHRSPFPLIWRTRWLLLVLILGYAYSLPGAALLPGLGGFSPSLEGTVHGLRSAMGLLALLLWLDVLVLALPVSDLLGGLYQLAQPFRWLGLDGGRFALRLGLTLKAVEGLERGRGNLTRLLDPSIGRDLPERIEIRAVPFSALDLLVPCLVILTLAGLTRLPWPSA